MRIVIAAAGIGLALALLPQGSRAQLISQSPDNEFLRRDAQVLDAGSCINNGFVWP